MPLIKKIEQEHRKVPVRHQVAVISILCFWLIYFTALTLRTAVSDWPSSGEMAGRRMVVSAFGIAVTYLFYLVLRLFEDRPLSTRIITVFCTAIPFAITIAAFNHYAFNIYYPEFLFFETNHRHTPEYMSEKNLALKLIAEDTISRFFFIISWASIYLTLNYAGEARSMERKSTRLAEAAREAELRSLRYQVNPHFLFNTLNSLSALVMRNNPEDAEKMILNLSKFYRTSLAEETLEDVTLAQEVELQNLYLDIEAVRFPDRLRTQIDIPDELLDAQVPGLILQPLVENAIKHSVSQSLRPVTITIRARASGNKIILSVADDGDPRTTGSEPVQTSAGIGINNVRHRLQTRFGRSARLEIIRPQTSGFLAQITLPLTWEIT